MVREIRWPQLSQKQLAKAYEYISKDSYQNAEKIKKEILLSTRKLSANPGMHAPDRYRKITMGVSGLTRFIVIGSHTGLLKKKLLL